MDNFLLVDWSEARLQYTGHLYPELFVDYLSFSNELKSFYRFNPYENKSFSLRMKEINDNYSLDRRKKLVECLSDYNKYLSNNPQVKKSIEKLKDPESAVIITGQQPGVLTGPLYTVYKAITAIKLAKEQEKFLGKSVVPVFWLASDDHDINEINCINLKRPGGKIERLKLFNKNYNVPIGDLPLNENGKKFIDKIEAYFNNNFEIKPDFFEKWIDIYKSSLDNSNDLPSWTARILMCLFSTYGLLVIDPMLFGAKELSKDVFLEAVSFKNGIYEQVHKKKVLLEQRGYEPVLSLKENHSGLFYNFNNNRKSLLYDNENGVFKTITGEYCFNEEELKDIIRKDLTRISPNVSLRPLVQDYIFPTLSYVAGPGEIGYFAQLKGVYESFGIKMPVIYPRERYVLIEPDINNVMKRHGIKFEDIFFGWQSKKEKILDELSSIDIDAVFDDAARNIKLQHEKLLEKLGGEFPQINQIGDKNWNHINRQLEYLKEKSRHYNRLNHKEVSKDLNNVKASIYPEDKLQERFYSIGEYLLFYDNKVIYDIVNRTLNTQDIQVLKL